MPFDPSRFVAYAIKSFTGLDFLSLVPISIVKFNIIMVLIQNTLAVKHKHIEFVNTWVFK